MRGQSFTAAAIRARHALYVILQDHHGHPLRLRVMGMTLAGVDGCKRSSGSSWGDIGCDLQLLLSGLSTRQPLLSSHNHLSPFCLQTFLNPRSLYLPLARPLCLGFPPCPRDLGTVPLFFRATCLAGRFM